MKKLLFLFCLSLLFGCSKDQGLLNDTPATQAQVEPRAACSCGPRQLGIRYTQGKLILKWFRNSSAGNVPANHFRIEISRAFQLDTVVVGKPNNELEIMCEIPLEGSIAVSISCVEHGMSVYQEYTRKANLPDPLYPCSLAIGHVRGSYTFSTNSENRKIMTVTMNRSGEFFTDNDGVSRIKFYSDKELTKYLFDFYYLSSEFVQELDITDLKYDRIYVTISSPHVCNGSHYFVGETPIDRYQEWGSGNFTFQVVNK